MAVVAFPSPHLRGCLLVAASLFALPGCSLDRAPRAQAPAEDAGTLGDASDAGMPDAGMPDTGVMFPDAGQDSGIDAGRDAGPQDAGIDAGFDACIPSPELCDGVDNDCDPSTPDGFEDPRIRSGDFERPCESDDADLCSDDVWSCVDGAVVCPDQGAVIIEICGNEIDEDCDMDVDEAEGGSDALTYFPDADGDGYHGGDGLLSCESPVGYDLTSDDCDDARSSVNTGAAERCGIEDDDCDGIIDEGDVCPCRRSTFEDRVYLYCDDARGWRSARDRCRSYGGHLVAVSEGMESAHLQANMTGNYWIGLNDRDEEDEFRWVDASGPVQDAWAGGQPDDFFGEDCVEMRPDGRWNDLDCSNYDRGYICEIPPQPSDF